MKNIDNSAISNSEFRKIIFGIYGYGKNTGTHSDFLYDSS